MVHELIANPQPSVTYESLNAEVLKHNTASAESRFRSLMQDERLRDRCPTEFLRWWKELSDSLAENAPIIYKKHFSHLPPEVQTMLVLTLEVNMVEQLATMADQILEFSSRTTVYSYLNQTVAVATAKRP